MRMLGIVLIVVGALVLLFRGFNYTDRDKVLDVGPIEATVEDEEHVNFSPIAGGAALAAGVILLLASRRRV